MCRYESCEGIRRFLKAQEESYPIALREIQSGRKRSHWMWYIFPQLACLGRSETARYYGIRDEAEAREYWADPVLSARLLEISSALLEQTGTAWEIMRDPDDLKLRSSMTLFLAVSGHPVFRQVLDRFYHGEPDPYTLRFLNGQGPSSRSGGKED